MPPHSRELYQEGAAIKSEKLVSEGKFNEKRATELLYDEPAKYPECSGTRCLADNINDLKAQVAANQKGISLISTLIEEYGQDVNCGSRSMRRRGLLFLTLLALVQKFTVSFYTVISI